MMVGLGAGVGVGPGPGAGVVVLVSSVKVSEALAVLPAASVSLATTVCVPSARPVGVKDQAPDRVGGGGGGDGAAVDREANDGVGVAGAGQGRSTVILSVDEDPVSLARRKVTGRCGLVEGEGERGASRCCRQHRSRWRRRCAHPSARPRRREASSCPIAWAVAVAAMALPSTVKCTTALASPVPVRCWRPSMICG